MHAVSIAQALTRDDIRAVDAACADMLDEIEKADKAYFEKGVTISNFVSPFLDLLCGGSTL